MLIRLSRQLFVLILLCLPALASAQATPSLLQVSDAFKLSARMAAPGTLQLHWTIAPHYYLYRARISAKPLDAGVQLGALRLPNGLKEHDPYLGDVEIYHNALDAALPYTIRGAMAGNPSSGPSANLRVAVTFQGCHEVDPKICYPPATQTLEVPLTGVGAGAISLPVPQTGSRDSLTASFRQPGSARIDPPGSPTDGARVRATRAPDQSAEQQLAGLLGAHGFAAIMVFFVAGLGLALTPCVWPMIPILSGLIAGAGTRLTTARAFALSLVYVLATCVVFTILGVIAGVAGANLAAWMQQPAILIAFAILFVLLAFSMFGLYSLQLPAAWQTRLANVSNRQRGGSLTGVAVMGVLSALIVGPCVAPPLAAAVLYIGQSRDPVFGGAALFALSLGMGVPLLVIGTAAGRWLPRAGAWMNVVKAIFGVLFLGVAIWMLSRILDARWVLAMAGALLVGCAVFLGALKRTGASGWRRAAQVLGLIALVIGACELVGAAAGSRNLLTPLAGMFGGERATAQTLAFRPVKTVDDVQRAIAAASAAGQPALLDFYADWCVSCKEMEALTLAKPQVQHALRDFVLLRADVTANDANDQALLKHYGLFGPPATLLFGKDGSEQRALRLIGYEDAGNFNARLDKLRQ
ncbi:MAG TPA: protein-disulfide reductase DsbD [Rhodanobacteraceae bacterium]|nr:protein-disulfide reductase DsbD [Rhodanobacteraceae bacterium]